MTKAMVDGLGAVIRCVKDMQVQVDFYAKTLGLPLVYHSADADFASEFWVPFNAGGCKLALHGGGAEELRKDAPKIVFFVKDLDAARSQLAAKGVTTGEIRSPAPGVHVIDFKDPEGKKISFETTP